MTKTTNSSKRRSVKRNRLYCLPVIIANVFCILRMTTVAAADDDEVVIEVIEPKASVTTQYARCDYEDDPEELAKWLKSQKNRKSRPQYETVEIIEIDADEEEDVSELDEDEDFDEILDDDEEFPASDEDEEDATESEETAKISAYGASDTYYYNFSDEDKAFMARTVYAEARGECFEGQVALAAVIINRYYSEDSFFHNDSIESVVKQNGQFAPIGNVTLSTVLENTTCMDAVEAACKGWDPTRTKFETGACYFFNPKTTKGYEKEIRTGIEYVEIGNHRFHNDFNKK